MNVLNEKRGWGIPSGTDREGPWGLRLGPDRLKQEDLLVTFRADKEKPKAPGHRSRETTQMWAGYSGMGDTANEKSKPGPCPCCGIWSKCTPTSEGPPGSAQVKKNSGSPSGSKGSSVGIFPQARVHRYPHRTPKDRSVTRKYEPMKN